MTTRRRKTTDDLVHLADRLGRDLAQQPARRRVTGSIAPLVRAALTPVEPSQQFVAELGRSLMATAARSRQSLARRYRMAIVIGAAAFGSLASVVGIVALIVRRSRVRAGLS